MADTRENCASYERCASYESCASYERCASCGYTYKLVCAQCTNCPECCAFFKGITPEERYSIMLTILCPDDRPEQDPTEEMVELIQRRLRHFA